MRFCDQISGDSLIPSFIVSNTIKSVLLHLSTLEDGENAVGFALNQALTHELKTQGKHNTKEVAGTVKRT